MRVGRWDLLYVAVIAMQATASALFGLRIFAEWGSDFGVYFVGGMSINGDYGLYTGFFDHKGPLYYAFIRLLSALIPYSPAGAAVVLGLTCAMWFASIAIALRVMRASRPVQVIVSLGAVAVLLDQPSNASIALFGASFIVVSLAAIIRFAESVQHKAWCFTSFALLGLAVLTRIDALVMLPLIFFLGIGAMRPTRERALDVLVSLVGAAIFTLVLLFACSQWLSFTLPDYWAQGVIFNFTVYPEWYGTGSPGAHVLSAGFLLRSVLATGLLAIWALLLASGWSRISHSRRRVVLMLVLYTSAVFVATGSSKQYHLFIVYPGLLLSLGLVLPAKPRAWRRELVAASLVLGISGSVVVVELLRESRCIWNGVTTCPNRFSSLVAQVEQTGVENNEFFINQGWPFLLVGRKATVSFTPLFPLGADLGEATRRVLSDSSTAKNKVIWVNDGDLATIEGRPGNHISEFLGGRQPLGEPTSMGTPMSPVPSGH